MVKKRYDTPVLEVIEIGVTLLQYDSPDSPMTGGGEDWDNYDI